ncbi:MAG: hypothetical protein AAGG01_12375, partial [Planctomycetota bacterium]
EPPRCADIQQIDQASTKGQAQQVPGPPLRRCVVDIRLTKVSHGGTITPCVERLLAPPSIDELQRCLHIDEVDVSKITGEGGSGAHRPSVRDERNAGATRTTRSDLATVVAIQRLRDQVR